MNNGNITPQNRPNKGPQLMPRKLKHTVEGVMYGIDSAKRIHIRFKATHKKKLTTKINKNKCHQKKPKVERFKKEKCKQN